MIIGDADGKTMARRSLLTFKPFRIFVVGIGFFSLCFLMTSLGGQFSAKRLGDSPFTIRTEVLGGVESRGVLKKISDMLEVILKRIDNLSKLDNTTTDARRLDELSSAISRFQPAGLVERIQAIAQNVSNMAIRVEQILQNSAVQGRALRDGTSNQCEVPRDPRYPECPGKVDWMRARWTSDPCYAFYGVDGSDCSFLIYLSEVEWFCPPLAWRNHSSPPTQHTHQPKAPKRQVRAVTIFLYMHSFSLVPTVKCPAANQKESPSLQCKLGLVQVVFEGETLIFVRVGGVWAVVNISLQMKNVPLQNLLKHL
uniref:alpha-1,6-mannosyl-glycoprotein 6-beta-N-acetylglucosaminyltransferase n=1 Tax=Takifugu rubripes TaxID=31033 RepID=A0A674MMN1_TAKRU